MSLVPPATGAARNREHRLLLPLEPSERKAKMIMGSDEEGGAVLSCRVKL